MFHLRVFIAVVVFSALSATSEGKRFATVQQSALDVSHESNDRVKDQATEDTKVIIMERLKEVNHTSAELNTTGLRTSEGFKKGDIVKLDYNEIFKAAQKQAKYDSGFSLSTWETTMETFRNHYCVVRADSAEPEQEGVSGWIAWGKEKLTGEKAADKRPIKVANYAGTEWSKAFYKVHRDPFSGQVIKIQTMPSPNIPLEARWVSKLSPSFHVGDEVFLRHYKTRKPTSRYPEPFSTENKAKVIGVGSKERSLKIVLENLKSDRDGGVREFKLMEGGLAFDGRPQFRLEKAASSLLQSTKVDPQTGPQSAMKSQSQVEDTPQGFQTAAPVDSDVKSSEAKDIAKHSSLIHDTQNQAG